MIGLPYQSYVAWRACVTIYHAIAILSSFFRIRTRYINRQLWLDDYLIVVPTTADLIYSISPWVFPSLMPDPRTTPVYNLRDVWILLLICAIILWSSRICFMLSLARIFPPGNPTRPRMLSIVYLFSLFFCSVVLLLALHCDPLNPSARHCVKFLGKDPATKYTYAVDTISDIIMIVTPLSVLWKVQLPKVEKRVILTALSSSTLTLLIFVALMFFTFGPFQLGTLPYTIITSMLSNLLAATSLLSSNILVIVTNIFRFYRRKCVHEGDSEIPEDSTSNPTSASTFKSQPGSNSGIYDVDLEENETQNINSMAEASTDNGRSGAPPSMYILTQISIDDYDSQCGPNTSRASVGPASIDGK